MYKENYINALQNEIIDMVAHRLTPVAIKYEYSDVPLESSIKWKPQVLIIGNYSSGKSTLINEFIGARIQSTGQAPTDDSFTVLTYDDSESDDSEIRVTEVKDGRFLLNDPEFPFEHLKKYGQRFASHFCLKKINSPFLKHLSLIDTPGMLDSISEKDRGYNYQEVIGDFAQNADLILILFDPHKAGTGREAHQSLRETLPQRTFEDRILFVLNRVDECTSLIDLIRVYGTLCWNLSQMTGRKDIPLIHLTYSPHAANKANNLDESEKGYLKYIENQREMLKSAILQAPKHQLDHLATFLETHSERLSHFLEAILNYRTQLRMFRLKLFFLGMLSGTTLGFVTAFIMSFFGFSDPQLMLVAGSCIAIAFTVLWTILPRGYFTSLFHKDKMAKFDELTKLGTQTRKDSWQAIRQLAYDYLNRTKGEFSCERVEVEYSLVNRAFKKGTKDIREALNELANLELDQEGRIIFPEKKNNRVDKKSDDVSPFSIYNG